MRIVIVGAGKGGAYLAGKLHGEHTVTVIDQRRASLDRLIAWVPDIEAVHGDACEPTTLEHANIAEADMAIAVTGDDEDNLVVSWLAKSRWNVATVLARVNHPANGWMFDSMWGVDIALSPPALLAAAVTQTLAAVAAGAPGAEAPSAEES